MLKLPTNNTDELTAIGRWMHGLLCGLIPLARSVTGDGLRATVATLTTLVPLEDSEVSSGEKAFDWVVPQEWAIDEAYIEDESGRRIVDWRTSNLHVVGYSELVDTWLNLAGLRSHLHSLPDRPDWVPYLTAYSERERGFWFADRVLRSLPEGRHRAVIRSRLFPGSVVLAKTLLLDASSNEILVFAHDCYPSLSNDNLSGLVVAAHPAAHLRAQRTRYGYSFVFSPATIGSLARLARSEGVLSLHRDGLVLSLVGAPRQFHYKSSRAGDREIDLATRHALATDYPGSHGLPFTPCGYDERQSCSPEIDLPMGRLRWPPNGELAEYHTFADNTSFVTAEVLGEAWLACVRLFKVIERNQERSVNLSPKGEPQLGRRGLYRSIGGYQDVLDRQLALLRVLNQSDGRASLPDIARKSNLPFNLIADAADDLEEVGLLAVADQMGAYTGEVMSLGRAARRRE